MIKSLKAILSNPATRGLEINQPELTAARRQILAEKGFLRKLYLEWYQTLLEQVPHGPGEIVELGTGPGFMKEIFPYLVTTDLIWLPSITVISNGCQMPFANGSLRGIVMTDVLHHIPDVRAFFSEAERCIAPGGVVAMVEPWLTKWSTPIYTHLHDEPFFPGVKNWEFVSTGPLSGANGALPWIVFQRDREVFESEFPQLRIETIRVMMPFAYLLSGGLSMRGFLPSGSYRGIRFIEGRLNRGLPELGMFALIVLRRAI